jgi:hypothetical protein
MRQISITPSDKDFSTLGMVVGEGEEKQYNNDVIGWKTKAQIQQAMRDGICDFRQTVEDNGGKSGDPYWTLLTDPINEWSDQPPYYAERERRAWNAENSGDDVIDDAFFTKRKRTTSWLRCVARRVNRYFEQQAKGVSNE